MTGKPKRFVMLLFQRQETRLKDCVGVAHTQTSHGSCIKTLQRPTRMCLWSMGTGANLHVHSHACPSSFILQSLALFLITVHASGNLLMMPINGKNFVFFQRHRRNRKRKRLLPIKSALSLCYF